MRSEIMKELHNEHFTGERALFQCNELRISGSVFDDGESPLKHSRFIELSDCTFGWKYPIWYSENIRMKNCRKGEHGRAGIWYVTDVKVEDTVIEAPKCFRHSNGISMNNVSFPGGQETLWKCANIRLNNVTAEGDYFAMDCDGMEVNSLKLTGGYSFDGVRNVTVKNSVITGRDAFWNSENVIIYDSVITGKYFCWNSRNITLVNCTVESLQGMCYTENLILRNCKLPNTTLAFEYSTVNADIKGGIDSIMNPYGGVIKADSIGETIMDEKQVDVSRTKIIVGAQ